ncbi:MAG: PrsW family intramembrane metalloprotease [Halorientalis sp.]
MNLRKVLRIARWEVTRSAGGLDRRTLAVAGVVVLVAGLVAPMAAAQGVALDAGIYRVGVEETSPYYDVVVQDSTFAVREPSGDALQAGRIDVLVRGTTVIPADSQKGRAAVAELRAAVEAFNDERMHDEANESAAFPISVTLTYVDRQQVQDVLAPGGQADQRGPPGADGAVPTDGDGGTPTEGEGPGGTDGAGTATGTDDGGGASGTGADGGGGGALAGLGGQLGGSAPSSGSPSDIAPPFPFRSLVLAFLFVLPMNFVVQAYGSSILSERLNRRGELLLVAPVTRVDVIGGKTLPYFGSAMAIVAAIAGGLSLPGFEVVDVALAVAAVAPITVLFLAATFVGAMFARSFKELTFVTVTVTVSLTTYAFVPAIFTDVNAVALISPLTLVVRNLQGQAVDLGAFAFSTVPPTLTAGVLFALGAGLYREEDMFTQRPIPLKVLDAFAARVRGKWTVALLSALLLPFVFVAELVGVALLFAVPQVFSIPAILAVVAVIEEVAKSVHVYAGYAHRRFAAGLAPALVVGAFSGLGFFVGEKLTLLAQVVGLQNLAVGRAALVTGPTSPSLPLALAFLLAPLALHTVTAAVSAVGASRGRRPYVVALAAAVGIHLAYNLTVVSASGLV